MFPLAGSSFPTNPAELRDALHQGFVDHGITPRTLEIGGGTWPLIDTLRADLTGAEITRERPLPQPSGVDGQTLTIERLEVWALPLLLEGAPVQFSLRAAGVTLAERRNSTAAGLLLVPIEAREGSLDLQTTASDLEALVLRTGSEAAKSHGVELTDVRLSLSSPDARALHFEAHVTAKAFLMKAPVTLSGRAEIDGSMVLHLRNLGVTGSGMAVTMVKGFLKPYFEKLEARPIPLTAFSLGEMRLCDVQIQAGQTVRLHATFGG